MKIYPPQRAARNLLLAISPLALFAVLAVPAQEPSPAPSDATLVAPVQDRITLTAEPVLAPSAPLPTAIVLKNNRLFYVLANYSTVERHDDFGTLSSRTKFKLSVKTMTDPITVSFLGA